MDIISTSQQVAKKDHKCSYCDGVIPKGENYRRAVLKYDNLYVWKSHHRCDNIVSKLRMHDNCDEGVTQDDFYEIIKEEFHNLQTIENYFIPDFYGQLDYVCEKHNVK